ncbi:efflux RND transporter permease subunit [Marinospirillum alkaliphilum]|uniref:Multidrug efflux pump n=1 Tax=Marinospirillum alkaliphilum DSM 21637 TaxID=1122209 RepID=A0A1K1VJR7_9GAMM|nr:efflux RND transporter permease subunit [Marinospirillum alkaliphilum]SFX25354.1 multidrug efflux pump [Marinospirillum alkaliphilum DSM 21637]
MKLSETAVRRPVFALVISLLLLTFGLMAWQQLPLRQYPDVTRPEVVVMTSYTGASAEVVELQITNPIEDQLSGIEGIRTIQSNSARGISRIVITFSERRDLDNAANDVREAVARVMRQLPDDADTPLVMKRSATEEAILYIILGSTRMTGLELTDYARRTLQERLSLVSGVSNVLLLGAQDQVMRVELDPDALNARQLTVNDIISTLRQENLELRAGRLQGPQRTLQIQISRDYNRLEDFQRLVLRSDGQQTIRLGDVAQISTGARNTDQVFRSNGRNVVGLAIEPISTANPLDVIAAVKQELDHFRPFLPDGADLDTTFDASIFIQSAINEVYFTLGLAMLLVVLVIFIFLGTPRATLIPAITVPVSLIAAFIGIALFGFSINLMTLLALVLAIGLVVDDAIVVLENIHRHLDEGKPPLLAAWTGIREVGFAVIATTTVLIATFVPIIFLEGTAGQFFREYALTLAAAVAFSSLIALTLTPVLCSKLLKAHSSGERQRLMHRLLNWLEKHYRRLLEVGLNHRWLALLVLILALSGTGWGFSQLPRAYAPQEDQGSIFIFVRGQEGASAARMRDSMMQVEERLLPLLDGPNLSNITLQAPGFSTQGDNSGFLILSLKPWNQRPDDAFTVLADIRRLMADIPDVVIIPRVRSALTGGGGAPVRFVLGGSSYEELQEWAGIMMRAAADNPGLVDMDTDFNETQPQVRARIDRERAALLGVSAQRMGETLEVMLGGRAITRFEERGREYDVWLVGQPRALQELDDLGKLLIRSDQGGQLIRLDNLVSFEEVGETPRLPHYNRNRAITLSASLAEGYSLGEALDYLDALAAELLPPYALIDYRGESLDYRTSSAAIEIIFLMALVIVFLVLAAQFESFVHPFVVLLTVPLGLAGAMLGLWWTGETINIYTQLAMIMLIGLSAKNGILIVEFANQLRDQGLEFRAAILEASRRRLRPILMTAATTLIGTLPLLLATGAGSESRQAIGLVVFSGVALATLLTLLVVPLTYNLLARHTGSPETVSRLLEQQQNHQSPRQ